MISYTHSTLLHDAIFTKKNTRFGGLVCVGGLNCSRLLNYAILQKNYKNYKCSEVTRKNGMNKCKRQSAFWRPSRHFSFNDFKFEYSRPLVLPKNAARSQQKKGIVR